MSAKSRFLHSKLTPEYERNNTRKKRRRKRAGTGRFSIQSIRKKEGDGDEI